MKGGDSRRAARAWRKASMPRIVGQGGAGPEGVGVLAIHPKEKPGKRQLLGSWFTSPATHWEDSKLCLDDTMR